MQWKIATRNIKTMAINKVITKTGKVRWRIVVSYGRGNQLWATRATYEEAKKFEAEKEVEKLNGGTIIYNKKILFADYANNWLDRYSKIEKAPSSHIRDMGILKNHLLPYFGKTYIQFISTESIADYKLNRSKQITPRGKAPTPKTINNELQTLSEIMNYAVANDKLVRAPLIKKFRIQPEQDFVYLEHDEVKRLLESADDFDRPLFATAVFTGMRKGELFCLKKESIDLKNGIITIKIGSVITNTTKNRKIRRIGIPPALLPYLKQTMDNSTEYVFPSKENGMRREARRSLRRALRRAKITKKIRFHDLRHTFASNYMMQGGKLYDLQKILGHSSLAMVQRYAHLSDEHIKNKMRHMNYNYELLKYVS